MSSRALRCCWRVAVLLCSIPSAHSADVFVVLEVPWSMTVGAAQLQAGAGTDFKSPIAPDALIAVLAIRNTGGASWNLKISGESTGAQWPEDVIVELRRGGTSAEAGISNGLAFQTLTSDPQTLFSGTGNYESVEILLRLDEVAIATAPGTLTLTIEYSIELI